jgi:hypothetical protein
VPASQYHSLSTGEHCEPTTAAWNTVLATEKASAPHAAPDVVGQMARVISMRCVWFTPGDAVRRRPSYIAGLQT